MDERYDPADFVELAPSKGKLRLQVLGQVDEMDFTARNFMNKAGTVGYSAVNVDDKVDHMFLSKVEGGKVLTIPGENAANIPFQIEGYRTITTTDPDASVEQAFEAHMAAMGEDAPIPDEAWLRKEVPETPQKATEVIAKVLEAVFKAMGDFVEGMGQSMQQAMGQMFEGMDDSREDGPEDSGGLVCVACGAKIDPEDRACPECGEKLD